MRTWAGLVAVVYLLGTATVLLKFGLWHGLGRLRADFDPWSLAGIMNAVTIGIALSPAILAKWILDRQRAPKEAKAALAPRMLNTRPVLNMAVAPKARRSPKRPPSLEENCRGIELFRDWLRESERAARLVGPRSREDLAIRWYASKLAQAFPHPETDLFHPRMTVEQKRQGYAMCLRGFRRDRGGPSWGKMLAEFFEGVAPPAGNTAQAKKPPEAESRR